MDVQLTADIIVWRLADDYKVEILLIERGHEPFKNKFALPGGRFENDDQSLLHTAQRELGQETSIIVDINELSFIDYLDQPQRDPRKRTIGFVFAVRYREQEIIAQDDAVNYQWKEISELIDINLDKAIFELAFDHKFILTTWYTNHFSLVANTSGDR